MRRTLLGSCKDCYYCQPDDPNCNDSGYPFSCRGCSMSTKPKIMGSSKNESPKPNGPLITCRCLQDATKTELKNHECKYWRPIQ